ncbi:hypothetical protein L0B53_18495 (plasmid) [Vibrio sp. SS-MA-C1-2]|nr:hypothetical protein [Vibrio sp. SS-MA-C1-2]UJF20315.1 hypothetical protein L0B53_18495 [Vibrio sp. SS-MA-C1-2]
MKLSNQKIAAMALKSNIEGMTNSKIIEVVSSPLDSKARTMEYRLESFMAQMIGSNEKNRALLTKKLNPPLPFDSQPYPTDLRRYCCGSSGDFCD